MGTIVATLFNAFHYLTRHLHLTHTLTVVVAISLSDVILYTSYFSTEVCSDWRRTISTH